MTRNALWNLFLGLSFVQKHCILASTVKGQEDKFSSSGRERISINEGWRFWRSEQNPDGITYDNRTDTPQENVTYLRPWILPTANEFIPDDSKHYEAPSNVSQIHIPYTENAFDDSSWQVLDVPHDWAIKGPFYQGDNTPITGGMGRLPSQGVGWYRRNISVSSADQDKITYLDIDGAMSYAIVWLNGRLVGGWPYGYNSFRLNLTPYLKAGEDNLLAIRLDNPVDSSRWYPGGGLYRNVWLTKVGPVHIGHWGTQITTRNISSESATVDITVQVENMLGTSGEYSAITDIYEYVANSNDYGPKVEQSQETTLSISSEKWHTFHTTVAVPNPRLWGPPPSQTPNMYIAVTRLISIDNSTTLDTYETPFGIRSFAYSGDEGLLVNGERIRIQGVNEHCHDLGSLGSAWNTRAAERKLEKLRDLGVNAIRMAHNPPAPELLDLCDRMGFLVMDEIFDCWENKKTPNDFHLIFPEWHEADLRAFIRRDRNHASIYSWSVGNEVGEQTCCGNRGFEIGTLLSSIVKSEDKTRPITASMNVARPNMTFPKAFDILSLNYQGEGIRDTPQYSWTNGSRTPPQYQAFHDAFPDKLIAESESAAALSSRYTYLFPVTELNSAPVNNSNGGGNSSLYHVQSYELHTTNFGSAVDKVFAAQDSHPFVAGEFVWTGWDYLGEPDPYYDTRSSYFGIIDMAGFPKDRWYLYQSRWRPDLKIAHIVPAHWNFAGREGAITPVHIFTNGDEAEVFVNEKSYGRKKLNVGEYRFRFDEVVYEPGEVRVVTYKNGTQWATSSVHTTDEAVSLRLTADRDNITADGKDLSFVTLEILDKNGDLVRTANNAITFTINGPGEIIATDNGFEADFTPFPSNERQAFNGFALAIIKANKSDTGEITVKATSTGLEGSEIVILSSE